MKKNNKQRLLFFIAALDGGGAEKVLCDILNNFDYTKFTVDICLVYNRGIYKTIIPPDVKQYFLFPCCFGLFFRLIRLLYALRWKSVLAWYINKRVPQSYDVGIAFLEGMATQCMSLKKKTRKKMAWVHIDLYTYHWTLNDYSSRQEENDVYRSMDAIVFVAGDTRDAFNKRFLNVDPKKEYVIYDAIDKDQIVRKASETIIRKEKLTLCTVGRLSPQKGYDRLIRVCKRLHEEGNDFELWIVGEGSENEYLKNLTRELKEEANVRFWGFQGNPYPYIQNADVFVSSSVSEGFALVIAEALCLGKPIVSTLTAGPRELLKDGKYGLLTENTEESLYEGLKRMINSPDARQRYGEKALEGSAQFDLNRSIHQITDLITHISKS